MIEIKGKYNEAKIFTDHVEETAMGQIIELCNQEFTKGSKIRIMPDVHAGAGSTIGTTMTIHDKVVPNLVGVDIGCGVDIAFIKVDKDDINYDQLDEVIRKHVPSGFSIRNKPHMYSKLIDLKSIRAPLSKIQRIENSLGTLGGGNHFIELNEVEPGVVALVIHSGSRNLGMQVAKHYQDVAYNALIDVKSEKQRIIDELKAQGREKEIHEALRGVKQPKIKKDLAYLEGQNFKDYMHDMKIAQKYALYSRRAMIEEILRNMGWEFYRQFTTIHNYIDMSNMILRKGAISAQKGEPVVIPINMRDGSIIARGKGNPDWNFSGPHGAGRVLSRTKAKEQLGVEHFKAEMMNVWTSSVGESTLDEAPMAYKPIEAILDHIEDSVEVQQIIKPVYNFKAN